MLCQIYSVILHELRAEPQIKFICEYKYEYESDIFCDFTQLKAEDPVLLSSYHQAVTHSQEASTTPICKYLSYQFLQSHILSY